MKTYNIICVFIILCTISCSKSDENSEGNGEIGQSVAADYTLLLNSNNKLTGTLLNGDAETLNVNELDSGFVTIEEPLFISEDDNVLTMYLKESDCGGAVNIHDFKDGSSSSFDVFTDLEACNITPKAIVKGDASIYVAYEKEVNTEITEFAVRSIEISGNHVVKDIALTYNPVGLTFSNNRLFVLGLEEEVTGEHKLSVLDANTDTIVFEENLGYNARTIFKNPEGNIIIGYDELHTTIDSRTIAFTYTNYAPGSAPSFAKSTLRHFDSTGKMYYAMVAGDFSEFTEIPAVYNFKENSAVLYAFENFLTEAQLKFEFEIENTTMVNYDEANNLLLVGYKKSGDTSKGGLLRIKPTPQPEIIGNINLDGIPYAIYFN